MVNIPGKLEEVCGGAKKVKMREEKLRREGIGFLPMIKGTS